MLTFLDQIYLQFCFPHPVNKAQYTQIVSHLQWLDPIKTSVLIMIQNYIYIL